MIAATLILLALAVVVLIVLGDREQRRIERRTWPPARRPVPPPEPSWLSGLDPTWAWPPARVAQPVEHGAASPEALVRPQARASSSQQLNRPGDAHTSRGRDKESPLAYDEA